ncbi:hypothetical protein [Azonexus sp.]|uniref:hypothetical protein n=1 Tax=Azonexus sp. TaxID=1872668 RepID=UPI0035B31E07
MTAPPENDCLLLARALPESDLPATYGLPDPTRLPALLRCFTGVYEAQYALPSELLARHGEHPAIRAAIVAYAAGEPLLLVRFSRARLADLLAILLQQGFAGFSQVCRLS